MKKYSHHIGAGGYKKAVKKWQKMEHDLIDRGIRPTTWDWPDRSKWWLFANGVTPNSWMEVWSCPSICKKCPAI